MSDYFIYILYLCIKLNMPERFQKINDLHITPWLSKDEIDLLSSYLDSNLVNPSNYNTLEVSDLGKDIKILLENDYRYNKLTPELRQLFEDGMTDAIWDDKLWNYFIQKQ